MYETKHKDPASIIPRGKFPFRELEEKALILFTECPKITTLLPSVVKGPGTEVECWDGPRQIILTIGEGGQVKTLVSKDGVSFSTVLVNYHNTSCWLLVNNINRQGFLLPEEVLADDDDEDMVT